MKEIVTAFTVLDTPWHVLSFAIKVARLHSSKIHAIFLDDLTDKPDSGYPFPNDLKLTAEKFTDKSLSEESDTLMADNIRLFKLECDSEGISYHIDKLDSIKQLIISSSGADIFVADTKASFVEKVLPGIDCAACLVSENQLPEKVVLMYDGNASSVYAIKKYISLLPEWISLPTYLVYINPSQEDEVSIEQYIKTDLNQFKSLNIKLLQGQEEKELISFLQEQSEHVMVVMGAFGRSEVSRFFRQSLANVVLEKTRLSLFIAHA